MEKRSADAGSFSAQEGPDRLRMLSLVIVEIGKVSRYEMEARPDPGSACLKMV